MAASKYDFYEIVKIVSNDPKHKDINGKLGVIRGKAQHEVTLEWSYAILVEGDDELTCIDEENFLEYTGKKANPKDFEPVETIKVRVDPETGEGYIPEEE